MSDIQFPVKPITGQTWKHKIEGYEIKIEYINRSRALVFEEVGTGQRNGGCQEWFFKNFEFVK